MHHKGQMQIFTQQNLLEKHKQKGHHLFKETGDTRSYQTLVDI